MKPSLVRWRVTSVVIPLACGAVGVQANWDLQAELSSTDTPLRLDSHIGEERQL
jgi:hypothetical protein